MDAIADRDEYPKTAPAGLETVATTPEHFVGPLEGHHLACYTVRTGRGYVAYATVFAERPDTVWTDEKPLEKVSAGPFSDSEEALQAVVAKCTRKLRLGRPSRLSVLLRLLVRA
ncbi:hypothetical protein EZ313_22175 [Ramlibacter henchirensis]|uniref:Uncharacterized protein n=1 Tax=Ramlibacter henchirensis TaxID=204072 RepID=A0A4Z0BIX0_9BURK|nr:hypothetical protein [Ramlibacter henchirensis]TFY99272.1 hypothetical protein EZ313_22175 [Ramlibacter henchirensis]